MFKRKVVAYLSRPDPQNLKDIVYDMLVAPQTISTSSEMAHLPADWTMIGRLRVSF